jgi:hypothetical protein
LHYSNRSVKIFKKEETPKDDYKRDHCYKQIRNSIPAQSTNNSRPVKSSPQRMYLGRNKLYRQFKVWLLPTGEVDTGLYSALYRHTIESEIKKIKYRELRRR